MMVVEIPVILSLGSPYLVTSARRSKGNLGPALLLPRNIGRCEATSPATATQ